MQPAYDLAQAEKHAVKIKVPALERFIDACLIFRLIVNFVPFLSMPKTENIEGRRNDRGDQAPE